MPYDIDFTNAAAKDFQKLRDKKFKEKFARAVEELAVNPLSGKPLQGELKGCYAYRIGDYRVIYSFVSHAKTLTIVKIDHRRQVYR
jgi:mRNA interferase RelE/StbE